jgi:hydroxylaminobenzene mutase
MAEQQIERALSRAGALLVLLALVTGLAIPAFANPRQALATHVSAILGGLLLVGLASLWSRLTLSVAQRTWTMRLAIAGAYANLFGSLLAAAWGTTRLTPLAGAALADPSALVQGSGKHMRHVKIRPDAGVDGTALEALIAAAYRDVSARVRAG